MSRTVAQLLKAGENTLRIEVATMLERERKVNKKNWNPIGLFGQVELWFE